MIIQCSLNCKVQFSPHGLKPGYLLLDSSSTGPFLRMRGCNESLLLSRFGGANLEQSQCLMIESQTERSAILFKMGENFCYRAQDQQDTGSTDLFYQASACLECKIINNRGHLSRPHVLGNL